MDNFDELMNTCFKMKKEGKTEEEILAVIEEYNKQLMVSISKNQLEQNKKEELK